MEIKYIVRTIEGQFIVYKTASLIEAKKYIEKQEEPIMYEVVDIKTGKIVEE